MNKITINPTVKKFIFYVLLILWGGIVFHYLPSWIRTVTSFFYTPGPIGIYH